MFWQAATSAAHPDGYESSVLPAASTTYVQGKHVVLKQYRLAGPDGAAPARVTAKLRIRPIGIDVLRDLVASGDLDPSLVGEMATLTFGSGIEWTPADGWMKTFAAETKADCSKYRCLFDPSSDECRRAPAPAEPRQY